MINRAPPPTIGAFLYRSSAVYLAVLLIPIFWAIYFGISYSERNRALEDAKARVASVTQVFEENVESIFQDLDRSLLLLRLVYERDPEHFDLEFWTKSAALRSRNIVLFSIVGPDGYLRSSTDYHGPAVYLGDREHFAALASSDQDAMYIAAPVIGRITGVWSIKVARRLRAKDGGFGGVVVGSLDPSQIGQFFESAALGRKGSIVLRNSNHVILAARGISSPAIGRRILGGALETALQRAPSGFYWGDGRVDGIKRLIAYRTSNTVPLFLTTGLAEDEIFAGFLRQQRIYFAMAMLLTLILLSTVFWDVNRLIKLDSIRRTIEAMAVRFKSATENMSQGLSMFDGDARLVAYNSKYLQMYGLSADAVRLGCSLREFLELRRAAGTFREDIDEYIKDLDTQLDRNGRIEVTNRLADGRTIHIISCQKDDGGWVSTHEDITERKLAESHLGRVKNFLDTIIQNIPIAIVIKDPATRQILLVNRAYEEFHGFSREQLLGATVADLFPKDIAQIITNHDTDALNGHSHITTTEATVNTSARGRRLVTTNRIVVRDGAQAPEYLIAMVDDITERRSNEAKINQLAHYDPLTNLVNRTLFRDRLDEFLARMRRGQGQFAAILLDLDKFKPVNDTFGHQAGDALLKAVANRIRGAIRETDVAARLGGDEFALIVLPGQDDLEDGARQLAARLVEIVQAPYDIDGQKVVVGCSIGIALAPAHGERNDELLRNADLALYKAKNSGRNCFYLYNNALRAEADSRNALENDLREAIWREEFELFYQPVVASQTLQPVAVEALVRWRHPTKGLIEPRQFIGLAEDSGLIVQLGEWIVAKACHDAMKMPDGIKVAVNVSAVQFSKSNIVDTVIGALVDSQLPPERLELEITETVLLQESEQNIETLRQLQNLGLTIALDDFGVGYSSLSYLTSFPFDKVKIDRSFAAKVERPEAGAVITSIVQLAQTLGLVTCAEGIETPAQLGEIKTLGIELCQGYLLGAPAPLAELVLDRAVTAAEPKAA